MSIEVAKTLIFMISCLVAVVTTRLINWQMGLASLGLSAGALMAGYFMFLK